MNRNPFLWRQAEMLESDATFLNLFGAEVLDALPSAESLRNKLLFVRSAPGGGKTSLLRLFTPGVLQELLRNGGIGERKALLERLRRMRFIEEDRPVVLGVRIPIKGADYRELELLDDPQPEVKKRLFFALLNARVMILFIRSCLLFAGKAYPRDLSSIRFYSAQDSDVDQFEELCRKMGGHTGEAIYQSARKNESAICDMLDRFGPSSAANLPMHHRLWSLHLLSVARVEVDGQAVAATPLLMFDDTHELQQRQRKYLIDELLDRELNIHRWAVRWVAERNEVLSLAELLQNGSIQGRDYELITLDSHKSRADFKRRLTAIALSRLRTADAREGVVEHFEALLQEEAPDTYLPKVSQEKVSAAKEQMLAAAAGYQRFNRWLTTAETKDGSAHEKAIAYRELEIQITRELAKNQLTLDIELSVEALDMINGLREAAECMLAKERNLPYYFGAKRLLALASRNIEQFLELAGTLLQAADTYALVHDQPGGLDPKEQHRLIKKVAEKRLRGIEQGFKAGLDVRALVEAIGALAQKETFRPTAPYAPGVTGIAIAMSDYELLASAEHRAKFSQYQRLYLALESAIANNILEARPNQSVKNRSWLVLYLNRLLCVPFDLPLGYGGFREQRLETLLRWLDGAQMRAQ